MEWKYIQQLVNGVSLGAIYGLIAIGYTMVYGIIGMINFAHGEIYMISAYLGAIAIAVITSFFSLSAGFLILFALLFTIPVAAVHGFVLEKVAYKPLRKSPPLAPLITAIGMSLLLQNYVMLSQGARNQGIPALNTGFVTLWTSGDGDPSHITRITYNQIIVIVAATIAMLILSFIINRTSLGRQCRSTQQDRLMSGMLGINTNRIISSVFVIGAGMAGLGGVLVTLNYGTFDFFIGFVMGIKAFTAAVLGGIGSIPGAMLGGLILGMAESFFSGFVSTDYKDIFAFSLLIIFMIFKPTGILGKSEIDKV